MNYPPPNPFLQALFIKSNSLLKHCGPSTSIVILAPVSSSLNATDADTGLVYGDNLTDEFVQSHVLRIAHAKDEVLERGKARVYFTINGKTMVIKDDVIFPHRGFKGVREVKLLHDSLFWLDDSKSSPYLVYFLDKPLMGTPVTNHIRELTSPSSHRGITTWYDLTKQYRPIGNALDPVYAKLCAEFKMILNQDDSVDVSPSIPANSFRARQDAPSRRSRRDSSTSIAPAPLQRANTSLSFSDSSTLQYLRVRVDLVLNSAVQAFQTLPQNLLHTLGTDGQLDANLIENLIESHIMLELYDVIFCTLVRITKTKDEEIASAIQQSKYIDVTQLGTTSSLDLRARHALALTRFRGFGELHEPQKKLKSLLATITVLMRNSEKSSDDLIPSLVSVVLKAGVSNLRANILWIREFSFLDVESGEYGFALSTLEAVIYHITSSVKTLSKTSALNRSFFLAIKAEDETLVRELLEANTDLLDIRDLDDRTPHLLANDEVLGYLLTKPCSACHLSNLLLSHFNDDCFKAILSAVLGLEIKECRFLLAQVENNSGQSIAHKIHEIPDLVDEIYDLVDWQLKDRQGNSPLQVLARIYDHPLYETLLERVLRTICHGPDANSACNAEDLRDPRGGCKIRLQDHVDARGNTLAHIVSGVGAMTSIFSYCSGDFNTLNDKGLSPLLISVKFGRSSTLNFLVNRPEIDYSARDNRGHTAIHYAARATITLFNICVRAGLNINERALGSGVTPLLIASREGNIPVLQRLIELGAEEAWDWRGFRAGDIVKNDQVRSIMDIWACRGREVKVLRGHVGEDCSVKFLVKSKSGGGVLRSAAEFTKLRGWMIRRYAASGVPTLRLAIPGPCLIHSRPARSSLMTITGRLDAFVQALLEIPEISQNPIVWEFLLSPTTNDKLIASSIEGELERYKEQIWNVEKALPSYDSTQMFFTHAKEQITNLGATYSVFETKSRAVKDAQLHISVAYGLIGIALGPFEEFQSPKYSSMLEGISDSLAPKEPSLQYYLIEDIASLESRIAGLLQSLAVPDAIFDRMDAHTAEIERREKELSKTPRLQFNISMLIDSQSRKKDSIKHSLTDLHTDLKHAGSELRHYETVLADNLSTFYNEHERKAKELIRQFVKKQVSVEKERLQAMRRAIAGFKNKDAR